MLITNIEKFRRAIPMTKMELSKQVGVSCMAVSQWESGKAKPGAKAIIKLAEIFSCAPQEIEGGEDLSAYRRSDGISKPTLTETSTIDKSAKPRRRAKQAAALADEWED